MLYGDPVDFLHDRQAEAKFEALESTAKSQGFVIVLGKKYIWDLFGKKTIELMVTILKAWSEKSGFFIATLPFASSNDKLFQVGQVCSRQASALFHDLVSLTCTNLTGVHFWRAFRGTQFPKWWFFTSQIPYAPWPWMVCLDPHTSHMLIRNLDPEAPDHRGSIHSCFLSHPYLDIYI